MIMKKIFNSLFVIIASMVAFSACVKEENSPASETKTVQFFAESIETKTHFDAPVSGKYPTLWDEGDKVKILLNLESPSGVGDLEKTVTISEISTDLKSASFKAELNTEYSFPSYTFYAVVPSTAYNAKSSAEGRFTVIIPANQTPQEGSVDKAAQVLYAVSETSSTMPSSVPMTFKHYTAYGKLSLSNLTSKISTVSSITLESAGAGLAGKWNYFVADGSVAAREGTDKLTLTTSATENIWFACAPVDMSGKELILTVNTDKGPLSKTITFPANRKFESGKISVFTVDMAGIEVDQPEETDEEWVATAFADLKKDDQVVIVSTKNTSIFAMTNNMGTSSAPKVSVVTYANGKLTTSPDENIIWTVSVDGENRIFHPNGDATKWLYCTNTNNGVRVGTNANKTFKLDSSSGYMVHVGTSRYIGVYNNADWRCYTSINDNIKNQAFQFFVKSSSGAEGSEQPKILSSIAVSGQKVEYYVGESFVAPTVTATYEDGKAATVTASFTGYNLSEAGAQTVTVSYTENEITKTATYEITVIEVPAIKEINVAEFLEAPVSEVVWYQLTGEITEIKSDIYGNIYLKDETGSVYIYGLTSKKVEGSNDKSFASLGLKVGDQVKICTLRGEYNGTIQGGGNETPAYLISSEKVASWDVPVIVCMGNKVTITAESGATVYYTTNGENPTVASIQYVGPFDINETVTIKAIAIAEGRTQSSVAEKLCEFVNQSELPTTVNATLSFASTANRESQTTSKQVWKQDGITFTNEKASSTNSVANYSNPVRLYQNSSVEVNAPGAISKIVFDCNSSSYATAMKNSIGTVSGATVEVSSDKVTVTFDTAVDSFVVAKLTAQVRLDSITVTYLN